MIFITGSPRSGTSLVTKVLDSHKDIALLMENNFGNRRRHWSMPQEWSSSKLLSKKVGQVYKDIQEPIIGNKVCSPDVWWIEDILMFCNMFKNFKIIFIIRDPRDVVLSRYFRENYDEEFNELGRRNILLDFRSQLLTYTSSWRQSIEIYRRLRDAAPSKIICVYYENFIQNFELECQRLIDFIGIPFDKNMLEWDKYPHHDKLGNLKHNMKYNDIPIESYQRIDKEIPDLLRKDFNEAIQSIQQELHCWQLQNL